MAPWGLGVLVGPFLLSLVQAPKVVWSVHTAVGPTRQGDTESCLVSVALPKTPTPVSVARVDTSNTGRSTVRCGPRPSLSGLTNGVLLGLSRSDIEVVVTTRPLTRSTVSLRHDASGPETRPLPVPSA